VAFAAVNQPKMSALPHFKLDEFSVGWLVMFLTALDQDMEINIKRKLRTRLAGRVSVVAA
jgi:predicted XRE-type DNA-binding protein